MTAPRPLRATDRDTTNAAVLRGCLLVVALVAATLVLVVVTIVAVRWAWTV